MRRPIKRRPWWRSTIRVRLTLLYAGAFFLAGAILVALMYVYLGLTLDHQLATRASSAEQLRSHQVPPEFAGQLQTQLQHDRDNTRREMLIASLVALGVIGVAAGGFGWLLAGRALRPLQQITATARRVAHGSGQGHGGGLHERIAFDGPPDEVKDLADTFDAMLAQLEGAFEGQRRFVANASHELRTPLAINRTLIEVALDRPDAGEALRQLGRTLLAVNQRHERLIDGLLTLASSQQRLSDPTLVDLADVVRHVTSDTHNAAQAANVEVHTQLRPAPVVGDPVLLERLAHNLLDNAIRYNLPEGGLATVTTGTVDGSAHLTVDNTGPIVPPYELPRLFEPFRRLPTTDRLADPTSTSTGTATSTSRSAGLGLSIVRAVAHAHGGDLHARPREGGGLAIRVRLPSPPEQAGPATTQ
jgi:signal transduction histidine kinase